MMDADFDGPTMAYRLQTMPPDCPVPVKLTVPFAEAEARVSRAWWRGMRLGISVGGLAFIAGLAAGAAFGLDISGSTVTLETSADPVAFADVVFVNDLSNGPADTRSYTLSQDGILIEVRFVWDANFIGADQITVTPPLGMNCQPVNCTVTVIEGQTGRVTLFDFVGY